MKTNIKRFSKRSLAMLLSILMIVSAFFVMGTVTAYAGTNWNANIFFRVPDSWNLSTYPNVQAWAVQSSSASSGTKYAFLLGNMSVAGTTSNSRLYHAWVSANHGTWRTEYIAFTANTSNWGTGDFYISTCGKYTAPLNYGATNSSGAYLFSPSNASNNTASTNNTISGSYNGTNRDVLKKNQDFYVYTNGASSATGGSVAVTAHYVNGSSFNDFSAIASSDITVNSSDSGAHEQYGGAVEGSKVTMTATAATGYDFDGYYTAATGGNLISSDATYSYYVFGAKSVYARFKPKTYTITYNKGANGTGTVASTTKTHGVNATLSSSTFTRSGYTQTGWSTSDGGSKAYNLGGTYSTNADATLYPYWTQNTYAITLSETGGSGTMKIDGTTRSSGYAVTHGKHTFTVTAPTGKVVKSISGIGTWSGEGTETASLGSTSITSAKTITVEYEDAGTCGFTLSKSSTTLNIGGTDTITVTPNAYHTSGTISATSSNTSVATVSYNTSTNKATITAKSHGTATITISCTEGGSATISVTVNTPTISIALGSSSLNIGGTTTITPTVTNQGTATVTYTSSNTSVATISGTTITAVAPGTTNITATVDGVTSTAKTLTVNAPTITVDNKTGLKIGESYTPSPTLTNPSSTGSGWTVVYTKTTNNNVTTISDSEITGDKYDSGKKDTYKASYQYNGVEKASTTFTVKTADPTISMTTTSKTLAVDGTYTRTATGGNIGSGATGSVSYSSGTTSVATVNSSNGQVTAKTPGTSVITATYTVKIGNVVKATKTATYTVTVSDPTVSITSGNKVAVGDTLSLTATSSAASPTFTWAVTSGNAYATVSGSTLTGEAAGSATVQVTATYANGYTKTATQAITVETPAITVEKDSTSIVDQVVYATVGTNNTYTVGANFSGTLYAKAIDESIATAAISGTTLTITPVAKGSTTVKVSNAPIGSRSVATQTVQFTVNVAEAETYKYLYFTNGVNWSGVKAYLYGDGSNASFPGEAMVKIGKNEENKDVYAIRYPATKNYTNVIISKDGEDGTRIKYNNTTNLPMPSNGNNAYWASDTNGNAGQWNCTIVKPQIQANNVTIDMGSTQTMTATVLNNVTPSTFNWSSGTKSIATTASTTTASNVITGVAPGTSTITVKAYAAKPSGWASIVTDGSADDYVAGTATATATVVAENKKVTFGAKKTDDGSTFTDLSDAVTAKYYDADTSGSGSSGSGSGSDPEPSGGPYYLHIGKQNAFITNTAIEFTWNGSYYYASYNVDTANADYPFVINTKNTALGDSDTSSSNQSITALASSNNPDNISMWYTPVYNSYYGYDAFKFGVNSGSTGTIYITFTPSGGVTFRTSVSSGSGGSGSGGSGSGGSGSGSYTPGEGTAMTSPQSVPYGKVAKFTAEATKTVSDVTYHFAEWVDGSGNKLSSDNPYSITVTADKTVYARYYKVFKLSAFDSYEKEGSTVSFKTSPPKSITVKHGDDIYTYRYDGTALPGNPDSPDEGITKPQALPVASGGTFGQGNYIQYYAGDEITLHYSAMSSSEIFKGVFYNNSENYYVAKPTAEGFIAHDYTTEHTLYMNSAYYAIVPSGLPTTTVDNDDHTIKFTGTKDFKNIDVEMATKRKVYFSDYTNAIIGSKNTDDYYYDGEALSVTGDQLTVKAAGNATQTNSINKNNVKVYRADANGQPTGDPLDGYTIAYNSGSTAVENSGATDSTRYIIISGNMPSYDLYIDLGMTSSYTIKLGSKVMYDPFENPAKTRLAEIATVTIKEGSTTKLTAPNDADVTSTSTSVASSTALTLSSTFTGSWGDYYMFVGWYWGSDTAPDFDKGFISDKASLSYTPKKGGTIWAVGTRNLYINGSKYITGKDNNWYRENNVQKNLPMSYDAESGRYYWEISDTMFAAAGYNYKTWKEENSSATTEYGRYHTGDDQNLYWYSTDDKYHGKAFFQLFDQESGNANKTIWDQITYFVVDEPANGPTYGKVYPPEGTYTEKQHNGQGFINFNESGSYAGQSSPLRIYFDPKASGNARLTVESTKIYSNLYVSNGYTVGSTLKTSDVTVEPVVDGVVKTDGQSGYFSVGKQGNGWDPYVEGHVNHYKPQKKGATVRITKTVGGSDKIVAFFIYDITNKTVRAERDVKNSGNNYYIDLTLANSEQNLYIVPIVEEAGANVTISFDATQLNRKQWGDIVTAYAWYQNNGGAALGDYPGQPMIPSDDMTTWTAKFKGVKNSKKLEGITFSNYVDGAHSWLGCSGVMGSVSDHKTGTASGGIVNVYNHISSGTKGEYSRTNFKAQTYDYREPIALYDRFKNSDNVSISFSMKDGNSSLISWEHNQLLSHNIVTLEPHPNWDKLNWEYLTNAKGDKYIDLNGNTMKTKPTASFYIAAKGQVLYNNSSMTNVFYSGKSYDGISGVTYGGAAGVSMNYAVQWYVYDASGNYITNVLTAGIADMSSNNVDSYIGKVLEDKGYAVDGKSVAICYDKPRYMYGDAESGSGATGYNGKRINVGNDFDAYRFTGQWNAVASNELVKVNVGVGMMTDSGEVLASSNTAGYGNASASYDTTKGNNTRVTDGDGNEAPFTASDNSFVRTAVRDAENSPVKLNASAQNFIGWYYYDANTGDFVKANYASNENFYPNYSNKDVTFYAMYRASAVYQYKYTGREGARTYSAAGNDLTADELANHSVITPASHETDIKNKVPVGIGVFKKRIDFSPTSYSGWTKTSDPNGYILDITGFTTSTPTYTLTAHYKDASGSLVTITDSAVYNDKAVNLTDLNGGAPVTSYYGKKFLGWYAYDNGTQGELISTQTNYGLRLTRDQAVIAVYDEDGNTSVPEDGLHVSIDENEVNKELTTSDTGVFYNDTIVRVRDGSNVRASAVPAGATVGVLVVCDNKTNETINNYNDTQLATLANSVASGKTKKTAKGLSITNMQTTTLTSFNRTDIAVRRDYKTSLGAKYCVYAYIKNGSNYTFSAVSDVKTYE